MAESFSNAIKRATGIVSTTSSGAIGITTNKITGLALDTGLVSIGDMVVNQHYRAGAKVTNVGNGSSVTVDRDSTNTAAATSQTVNFLGATTAYSSPSATKSVLIGGTFANLTENNIQVTVEVYDNSGAGTAHSTGLIASEIPIPAGSSFVISEAGKTVLEAQDQLRVYCDTATGVDVNLSILKGVS